MTPAVQACLVAVSKGPLRPGAGKGGQYFFGRRRFSNATVSALRAMGETITMAAPRTPARQHKIRVTLDDDELAAVNEIARDEDRSVADAIRRLVMQGIRSRSVEPIT